MTPSAVRLRRGKVRRYDIVNALNKLGVQNGDDFAIVPVSAVDEARHADLDTQHLGPFVKDSKTSRQAALDNYPRQGSQRFRILNYILNYGPQTSDDLEEALNLSHQSVGPRMLELRKGGWLEPTGGERETRRGSTATLYGPTPKAIYRDD